MTDALLPHIRQRWIMCEEVPGCFGVPNYYVPV